MYSYALFRTFQLIHKEGAKMAFGAKVVTSPIDETNATGALLPWDLDSIFMILDRSIDARSSWDGIGGLSLKISETAFFKMQQRFLEADNPVFEISVGFSGPRDFQPMAAFVSTGDGRATKLIGSQDQYHALIGASGHGCSSRIRFPGSPMPAPTPVVRPSYEAAIA